MPTDMPFQWERGSQRQDQVEADSLGHLDLVGSNFADDSLTKSSPTVSASGAATRPASTLRSSSRSSAAFSIPRSLNPNTSRCGSRSAFDNAKIQIRGKPTSGLPSSSRSSSSASSPLRKSKQRLQVLFLFPGVVEQPLTVHEKEGNIRAQQGPEGVNNALRLLGSARALLEPLAGVVMPDEPHDVERA